MDANFFDEQMRLALLVLLTEDEDDEDKSRRCPSRCAWLHEKARERSVFVDIL